MGFSISGGGVRPKDVSRGACFECRRPRLARQQVLRYNVRLIAIGSLSLSPDVEDCMIVAVVDGMGGGIGAQIVTQLRQELPLEVEILALGANAVATQKMMQAHASRGASGENAIRISIGEADFILAPIGVVVPNSMMGEITPGIAEAVAGAPGRKLLLPINQPHFEIIGIDWKALNKQIITAIALIREALES
jgi:hypothetical protein